jgi:glycosyltransferase involved in cell wall biosynthesis
MKILIPIGYLYPSENGGPALTLYWLGKELNKKNYDIFFITTSLYTENKVIENKILSTNYGQVIYLKSINPNYSLRFITYTLKNIIKHDLILITSIFAPSSVIFILFSIFFNKKIIVSPRGELDKHALTYNKFYKKFILFILNLLPYRKINFHVTSNLEKNFLKLKFKKNNKIFLIPNYIELTKKQTYKPDFKYILYIGRFHPKKAIENLIKALFLSKIFLQSDFILQLAGDNNNDYGRYLANLIQSYGLTSKIKFLGEVKNIEKEILYANAYFTVVPSHTENFCNVVIESLCQGTPVIASKGTPWEELDVYNIGFWVENSSETLSIKIDDIITMNNKEYLNMRSKSYNFVKEKYNIKYGVDNWIEIFENLYIN